MSFDFDNLQNHSAIPASYGSRESGYKRPGRNVLFLHSPKVPSGPRKNRVPATAWMAGIASLFWATILLLPGPALGAGALSLEQLTARTQETYEKTRDLKAAFIQEITIKSMKKTEREEGTLWMKNPKMMFWDYRKPKEKKLVINARTAWLYVPEDRVVYVQKAEDVYRSRTAVKFLSGIGKLSEDFHLRFSKENPVDPEGNYLLTLTAKEKGHGIDRLHLTVDGKNFHIVRCLFDDMYGNTTGLRFSDIQTNTGVSDTFFTFKPPAGVEAVQMSR